MVAQKLRKNGIPKRSGLQEGDRRASRALSLKLQVIDEYRMRQRQKVNGQCCAPLDETAKKFNVHKSLTQGTSVLKLCATARDSGSDRCVNQWQNRRILHTSDGMVLNL